MIVSQAINLLVDAELNQLGIKTNKSAILGFINSGILEIYKRFNLWEVKSILTMVDGTSMYALDGTDANIDMDLSDHEFLMVEEVWLISDDVAILDKKLTINDDRDLKGVSTPKFNQLEVKEILDARQLRVIYRAAPIFLTNEKATIPLPVQFTEALFHYVGYRGHGGVKGDGKAENNTHYQRFNASCERVKLEGLRNQDDLVSYKFDNRGFA